MPAAPASRRKRKAAPNGRPGTSYGSRGPLRLARLRTSRSAEPLMESGVIIQVNVDVVVHVNALATDRIWDLEAHLQRGEVLKINVSVAVGVAIIADLAQIRMVRWARGKEARPLPAYAGAIGFHLARHTDLVIRPHAADSRPLLGSDRRW